MKCRCILCFSLSINNDSTTMIADCGMLQDLFCLISCKIVFVAPCLNAQGSVFCDKTPLLHTINLFFPCGAISLFSLLHVWYQLSVLQKIHLSATLRIHSLNTLDSLIRSLSPSRFLDLLTPIGKHVSCRGTKFFVQSRWKEDSSNNRSWSSKRRWQQTYACVRMSHGSDGNRYTQSLESKHTE